MLCGHQPPPGRRSAPPDDRLERVTRYCRAATMETEGSAYWILRFRGVWRSTLESGRERTKAPIEYPARARFAPDSQRIVASLRNTTRCARSQHEGTLGAFV